MLFTPCPAGNVHRPFWPKVSFQPCLSNSKRTLSVARHFKTLVYITGRLFRCTNNEGGGGITNTRSTLWWKKHEKSSATGTSSIPSPPRLLHGLGKLGPNQAVLLGNGAEALRHAALHALQAAHVDVGLLILHQLPQLFRILSHLGLDVPGMANPL